MSRGSLKSRLIGSAGANLIGQVATVIIQLIQVPFLLKYWGAELYGEWLILFSIPGYLTLSELGVGAVASNRICMLISAGKREEALVVIRTTWAFLGCVILVGSFLIAGAWIILDWSAMLHLPTVSRASAGGTLALLGMMVLLSLPNTLLGGLYRSAHLNARGIHIATLFRLLQMTGVIALASYTRSLITVAGFLLALQCLLGITQILDLRIKADAPSLFGTRVHWGDLFAMWRPSLAFMLFPVANGLYFQAATLIVNATLGAVAVVLFNTTRTLTRALSQAVSVIKHSLWPEFSHLYGKNDLPGMTRLLRLGMEGSLLLTIAGSLSILIFAKPILGLWTHGQVPCDYPLIFVLSLASIVNGVWWTASSVLQAINEHSGYSLVYCLSCILFMSLATTAGSRFGLLAVPIAMLLVEAVTGVFVIGKTFRMLGCTARGEVLSVLRFDQIRNVVTSQLRAQHEA